MKIVYVQQLSTVLSEKMILLKSKIPETQLQLKAICSIDHPHFAGAVEKGLKEQTTNTFIIILQP